MVDDLKAWLDRILAQAKPSEVQDPHDCDCVEGYVRGEDGEWRPCPRCHELRKTKEEMERLRNRLREAGMAERYLEVDWEDLEMVPPFPQVRQAAERIHELVQSGENFAFLGPPGSGKTQALVLLAKAAVRAGISTRIYNVGRLALRVVSSARRGNPEFTEEDAVMLLVQPQLLLLDDLGGSDDYRAVERRILYHALEERAQKGLVVGFSSTLSAGDPKMRELTAHLGERSLERLKPLRVILFRHGRNFRDRKVASVWD